VIFKKSLSIYVALFFMNKIGNKQLSRVADCASLAVILAIEPIMM